MKRVNKQANRLKKVGVVCGAVLALVFCIGAVLLKGAGDVAMAVSGAHTRPSYAFGVDYASGFIDLRDATSVSRSGVKCGSDYCVKHTNNLFGTLYGSNLSGAAGLDIEGYYAKNTGYNCDRYYVLFRNGAFSWRDGWLDVKVCPKSSNSNYGWAVGKDGGLYDVRQGGDNRVTDFRFRFYKHASSGLGAQVGFKGIFYTSDNDENEGHKVESGLIGTWVKSGAHIKNSDGWFLGNADCPNPENDVCKVWSEVSGSTSNPIEIGYKSESYSRFSAIGVEDNAYKGRSRVGSSSQYIKSTGYVDTSQTATTYSFDCGNNGAVTKIQHSMKQTTGLIGASQYEIDRQEKTGASWGSWTNKVKGVMNYYGYRNSTSTGWSSASGGEADLRTNSTTLKPGQGVCERLKFKTKTTPGDGHTKTTKVCATAKVTNFAGKSKISGAASGENATAGTRKIVYISENNCSDSTGCKVKFEHYMSRSGSNGTSSWKVSRTSNANLMTGSRRIASNSNVGSGTFGSNGGWSRVNGPNGDFTIYPGMVLCEKITYKPSNDVTTTVNDTYTEICAAVKNGTTSNSTASIDILTKNNSVTRYNQYQREVYAKPDDTLYYKATYSPYPQSSYQLIPEQMRIDGGTIYPSNSINTSSTLQNFFNAHKGSLGNWNNGFSIHYSINTGSFGTGTLVSDNKYSIGDSGTKSPNPNSRTVAHGDAGRTVDERAKTNVNANTKTAPTAVTYSEGSLSDSTPTLVTNVNTTSIEAFAYARVPYNFITSVTIPDGDKEEVIDAGGESSVKYNVALNPKQNSVTTNNSDSYTTRAENVNRKLVVYDPATVGKKDGGTMAGGRDANLCTGYFGLPNNETSCGYSEAIENTIAINNDNEMENGKSINGETRNFYVQDIPAGSRICVAVAVFPASSGADTNWNNKNYSSSWRISNSKCYIIAKKPSLQVWGGNVYTNGKISTASTSKHNVSGYTIYKVGATDGKRYIFGSWGELGLIAGATVKGFASGAATGYGANYNGELWPTQVYAGANGSPASYRGRGNNADSRVPSVSPGGIHDSTVNFCVQSRLTISNKNCGSGAAGELGLSSAVVHTDEDKKAVEAKFIQPNLEREKASAGNAGDRTIDFGSNESYYYSSNQLTIAGSTVTGGTPKIVHAKNITIEGNIQYGTAGTETTYYTSLSDIPKLVVYADENININCSVYRIDALLIAGNEVHTCVEGGTVPEEVDAEARSNQLRVNGAIIAKKLDAERTYGAAPGANSIIPAEIINFDPSLYLWGGGDDGGDDGSAGAIEMNYITELSPRK